MKIFWKYFGRKYFDCCCCPAATLQHLLRPVGSDGDGAVPLQGRGGDGQSQVRKYFGDILRKIFQYFRSVQQLSECSDGTGLDRGSQVESGTAERSERDQFR